VKFAVVGGDPRRKAQPRQRAECPGCGQAMIAKCGEHRDWHWAHERAGTCDFEWGPETAWHRASKNQFPEDWQEYPLSKDRKKHIADVMTASGIVIEFQHSPLPREEREARENFYQRMVWVVNGLRRKRDRALFFASLSPHKIIDLETLTFLVLPSDISSDNALLRDWVSSRVPVYFDFGDTSEPGDTLDFKVPYLWRLAPRSPTGTAIVTPVQKAFFRESYLKGLKLRFRDYSAVVERVLALQAARTSAQQSPLLGFIKYKAWKKRSRFRS
jgi:competence protein CoiA